MYFAVMAGLILLFFRPQNFVPALEAFRPIQACTVLILLLWFFYRPKPILEDAIFRWQMGLLLVMILGLPTVLNHYWWLYVVVDYVTLLVMFSLGLVTVARFPEFRVKLLRIILLGFLFGSCWVLTHNGQGPPNSWMYDENDAAAALTVGLCLAIFTWTESQSRRWKLIGLVTGVACLAAIVETMSRGGFVGLVAAILTIAFLSGRLIRVSVLIIVLIAAFSPVVPDSYWGEVRSIKTDTENAGDPSREMERLYTWRRAWEMFMDNPVLGVGAGNFPWALARYELMPLAIQQRGDRRMVTGRVAHSVYFTILSELGLLGTVAFFAVMGTSVARSRRFAQRLSTGPYDESIRIIARFVPPAVVGYCVAGAFISSQWYPPLWLLASFAIVLAMPTTESEDISQPPSLLSQTGRARPALRSHQFR